MTCTLAGERATDVVTLTIEVNGSELPDTLAILAVEVLRQVNRIPCARLRIGDGDPAREDFAHSSGDLFVPGGEIAILAGYHGETEPIFIGAVLRQRAVARQSGSWLEVECRDPAFKMALTRRNRHFEDLTDSDLAEQLIGEHGLTAELTATSVTHPQLLQYQATDWDFMIARLEANGQLCVVEDGTVRSLVPSLDGEAETEVRYGVTLLELDAELDARTQTGAVLAASWDPAGQALEAVEAADPGWEGSGNLTVEDLTAATDRSEDTLWHGGVLASDALQAWADGVRLRARLAALRGRLRIQGSAAIRPGSLLELAGVSERFNGKVFVTGVRHELSQGDWISDAEIGLSRETHAEQFPVSHLPCAGLAPAVSGLQVGIVTQLADDPAGEYRIRVKVPVAGFDEQGVWARVATLAAGADRGSVFRPEVEDEVVLGFFHDDPAQPVVLGMLHSSAKAPPVEPSEDNHQKAYVSRSGIRLLFDDELAQVVLETPGGNRLTLSDDAGGISLEDQNGNTLVMDSDGIRLQSAQALELTAQTDLKGEGLNTEWKATTAFKAEGSASAELTSSGTLTINGSLVNIN
jgi:Rhs element Vgr protein